MPPPPSVELWPENWPPFDLFARNSTQWRVGASGAVGLDYTVIFHELDRQKPPEEQYEDTLDALRVIERAALSIINKG